MWEFKEELKNPCITGKVPNQFKNEDGDYDCVKAIIDWTLDFEMRGYGVKDTYIHIIKVTLIFDDWDYGLEEYVLPDTFAISTNWYKRDDFKWLTIFPVEIWVDLDEKKVEVEF